MHDVRTLVLSYHPLIAIETPEEGRVDALLGEVAADLGMPLFEWTVTRGLIRPPDTRSVHGTGTARGMLAHVASLSVEGLFHAKDLAPHLGDAAAARALREVAQKFSHTRAALVVSGSDVALPREVEHLAVHYAIELPSEAELRGVLCGVLDSLRGTRPVDVRMGPDELAGLLRALRGMTLNQARQALAHAILDRRALDESAIARVLERKARALRDEGLLDFHPVQDNAFELGGFGTLKQWLARSRVGFSEEARALNLSPPRGLLLVGVQGCGKSLACKAIAREWRLPLLKLEAARLYDKYVGESEKNFRRAVAVAESMAPVVLWIDELEKGFSIAGEGGGDGGLSRRLFGTFLTWLQEKQAEVFVVATANDVFALPPELLRKGRFDEIFFVDLPDPAERREIFEIHLRLRKQDPGHFDRDVLVESSEGMSGAEIEQAVIAALYRALHAKEPFATAHLLREIGETRPLSQTRREDIERLRALARDRFVPVR